MCGTNGRSRWAAWWIVILLPVLLTAQAAASGVDGWLFDRIHGDMRAAFLDDAVPVVNRLGDSRYVLGGVALALVFGGKRTRDTGRLVGAGFAASALVTETLKTIIARPRPLTPEDRRSMPSGHATAAFSVATVLSDRYPRWRPVFYGLASGVAFSRVYLGRHYPSDVLAGAIVGVAVTRIVLHYESSILSLRF